MTVSGAATSMVTEVDADAVFPAASVAATLKA
jgi:hypothetical protein